MQEDSTASRHLLQGRGGVNTGNAGRSGPRAFASVAQHKTPQAPKLTRKTFDRQFPVAGRKAQ
jgi:hypothetical protein